MTAPAPLTLLPAFEPLPQVSFSDSPTQTSPVSPVFAARSSTPAPSTPPSATPTPASAKHGSGSSNFFTRARSASLHNSSPVASFFRRDEEAPPPVPSLPSTPQTNSGRDFVFPSTSSAPISPVDDALYPPIKSVSVPHHSKAGKNWVYACRVVPEPLARPSLAREASAVSEEMARRGSLGRMELAGKGVEGAREPHTVWRTWTEFVEFSARLSNAFPVVNPPSPTTDAGSSSALPSSFYRQVPRLAKKVTLFVTRATLVHRQTDLDLFVRRLFDMPDQVKRSPIVRDFFRMREEDLTGMASPASLLSSPTSVWGEVSQDGPESFSSFLAAASSPNATVRPSMPKRRPGLAVKISTPNLRGTALTHDFEATEPARPAASRATTEDAMSHLRTSNYSVSTSSSTSSSITVTPQSVSNSNSAASLKKPSPLASTFRFGGSSSDVESKPAPTPAEPKKRPSLGPLRHFRSLQDLRHQSSAPAYPSEPMPKLASVGMLRAVTQPHPLPSPSPTSSPALSSSPFPFHQSSASSTYPVSPAMSRRRSGSKSSTSSFEDLWGGPAYMSPNPSSQSATFRHGPSGRLDRVPETAQRPRRPSMPGSRHTAGSIGTKASCGHSSTPSTSSTGSARSSTAGSSLDLTRSMGDYRSRRSSTDYSFSEASLSTPPTPHSEFGASSKYFIENGQLSQNNKVPPPPFFPVPPSMSAVKTDGSVNSHDGLPSSPRHSHTSSHGRQSSLDHLRPRTSSTSSARRLPAQQSPLDTILASPKYASNSTSACSSPTPQSPQDRPYLTFKLLHPDANLVLRIPRVGLNLVTLRAQVREKFASSSCAVQLESEEAHWGLVYTAPAVDGSAPVTQLIITEEDFSAVLERTSGLEKVALRVVA